MVSVVVTGPLVKIGVTHDVEVIAPEEANGPYSLKFTVPGVPVNPETVAASVIAPPRRSVTAAPGVVVILHVLNPIGPAKSWRVELMSGEERVWGNMVWTQPVKPSSLRLTPPSMNSFCETRVESLCISSRHTQPPHLIGVAPVFTPRRKALAGAPVVFTY